MAQQREEPESNATTAIEEVLKLEREGMEQLRLSQEQARQILAQARDEAAAIGRRADTRIIELHSAYLQNLQREVDLLEDTTPWSAADYDHVVLTEAARRLAVKLTGGA
jgi:hypothetical protein